MSKATCEAAHKISTRFLKENNYLIGATRYGTVNWSCNNIPTGSCGIVVDTRKQTIRFIYAHINTHSGAKTDYDYQIRLVPVRCYYGGVRWWFRCPLKTYGVPCRRRVGVLYLVGAHFGCRECHNLAYQSQQETHTGYYGSIGKILFSDIDQKESQIRVKYWKGHPTKRYQRLLDKHYSSASMNKKMILLDTLKKRLSIPIKEVK